MTTTYTAITTAHNGTRMVEVSRETGLDLASAKRAAKRATVIRDEDGMTMRLMGRKLVPAGPAPSLDAIVAEMDRVKSIEMPTGRISQAEADEMAEDLGDYSHHRTR